MSVAECEAVSVAEPAVEQEQPTALHRMSEALDRCAEDVGDKLYGRRLRFTPAGNARLVTMIGYLRGLAAGGDLENAERIAAELDRQLTWLAQYGGEEEPGEEFPDAMGIPAYKVLIGDDAWGLGSFALAWYRPVYWPKVLEQARNAMPDGSDKLPEQERDKAWYTALDETKKRLRVWKPSNNYRLEMDETRYRKPVYEGQESWCRREDWVYCYSFNGGLILHGQHQGPAGMSYGIHT